MVKYLLLLFTAFIAATTFAQVGISGVVYNADKQPLPYANIVTLKNHAGTVTDEQGRFTLNKLSTGDTLKISAVGYQSKLLAVKSLAGTDTIYLIKSVHQIAEVTIRPFGRDEQLGFMGYKQNASFNFTAGCQIAVFIENKLKREALIKSVLFEMKQRGNYKSNMRIRLLKVNPNALSPGEDLLDENVLIPISDLKKNNTVDLTKYNLLLPVEGVFVVLEWVSPDVAVNPKNYTAIAGNMSSETNLVWLNVRDRHWSHGLTRSPNGNYMTPNIGLKVAY